MKKTKIVCTIGSESQDPETLEKMHDEGMNCARINTAYGSFKQYESIVENVRDVSDIPIMIDMKGPEIRVRTEYQRNLDEGEILEIGPEKNNRFNHDIYDELEVNDIIYIDNGKIQTQIIEKDNEKLSLQVLNKGEIYDGKGVNIPGKKLSVQTISDRDLEIIEFAKDLEAEYIALSFVRDAQDIESLKSQAEDFEGSFIAKIENFQGLENFEEIFKASDCIIVARGDLGIEINLERVPMAQKSIIHKCNQKGKPVITATEMLESMIENPSPTRAEVSDIANAILDGTDAMMLSGETAVGKHPVRSVSMMSRIAREIEPDIISHIEDTKSNTVSDTISKAVQRICRDMDIDKVVTLTRTGYTAKMITRFRLSQWIIGVTPYEKTRKELELVFGVEPIKFDFLEEKDRIISIAKKLRSEGKIKDEDTVLFTAASRTVKKHGSNLLEIHKIQELLDSTNS